MLDNIDKLVIWRLFRFMMTLLTISCTQYTNLKIIKLQIISKRLYNLHHYEIGLCNSSLFVHNMRNVWHHLSLNSIGQFDFCDTN